MVEQIPKIDLSQTTELILQFCKENNLNQTFQSLSQETGIKYNTLNNEEDFKSNLLSGNWTFILKQLQFLSLDKDVLFEVYQQMILELLIEKEFSLSQSILKEQSQLLSSNIESYQKLWDYSQLQNQQYTIEKLFPKGLQHSRELLLQRILKSIELSNPHKSSRLVELLSKGLEYEHLGKASLLKNVQDPQLNPQFNKPKDHTPLQSSIMVQKVVSNKIFSGDFQVSTCTLSPNQTHLVIGGTDGLIEVWNYDLMQLDLNLPYQQQDLFMLHRKAVLSLIFSQDGKILASGDSEGIIKVWKFADGKCLRKIDSMGGEDCGISCLLLTSNNSQLIVGSLDKKIKVYGLKSGSLLKEFQGHQSYVKQILFMAQQSNIIISQGQDGQVLIWNITETDQKSQLVSTLQTPAQKLKKDLQINNIQLNQENPKELLISHRHKSVHLISIENSEVLKEYSSNQSKEEEITYSVFSSDYTLVYAWSTSRNLYIFDKQSTKLVSLLVLPFERTEINGIVIGPQIQEREESLVLYENKQLIKLEGGE